MGIFVDHTNSRFGKLVVESYLGSQTWLCYCDCGSSTKVKSGHLVSGNTKSCGCRKRSVLGESTTRHGMAGTRVHRIWKAMLSRCNNRNHPRFADYGGRGIKVCERWHDFAKFYEDMGDPPDKASIDRKDNDGDYTLHNCRWSSATEQNNNRRNSIYIDGVPLKKWAADNSLPYSTAYYRYKLNFTLEQP